MRGCRRSSERIRRNILIRNFHFAGNKSEVHIILIVVGDIAGIVCYCYRGIASSSIIKHFECQSQYLSVIGGVGTVEPYRFLGIGKLPSESGGSFHMHKIKSACIVIKSEAECIYSGIIADGNIKRDRISGFTLCS